MTDLSPYDIRMVLRQVRAGWCSVGMASMLIGICFEDVQMAVWGRIVL